MVPLKLSTLMADKRRDIRMGDFELRMQMVVSLLIKLGSQHSIDRTGAGNEFKIFQSCIICSSVVIDELMMCAFN